jgi:hypothetical protein
MATINKRPLATLSLYTAVNVNKWHDRKYLSYTHRYTYIYIYIYVYTSCNTRVNAATDYRENSDSSKPFNSINNNNYNDNIYKHASSRNWRIVVVTTRKTIHFPKTMRIARAAYLQFYVMKRILNKSSIEYRSSKFVSKELNQNKTNTKWQTSRQLEYCLWISTRQIRWHSMLLTIR